MRYNTIRGYQEGGESREIKRALADAFINKGISEADEELQEQAKKAQKEKERRGLFGEIAAFAGTYALPALAGMLTPTPFGLGTMALLKGLGAGGGKAFGEYIGGVGAKDVEDTGGGFLSKDFTKLKDYQESLGDLKGIGERALGKGLSTGLIDYAVSGGFKSLAEARKSKKAMEAVDPAIRRTMGFTKEVPKLGTDASPLQRQLSEGVDFNPFRNRGLDFSASSPETLRSTIAEKIPTNIETSDKAFNILADYRLSNAPAISGDRVSMEIARTYDDARKQYEAASRDWQKVMDIKGGDTEVVPQPPLVKTEVEAPTIVETEPLGNVLDDSGVFPKGQSFLGQSAISGQGVNIPTSETSMITPQTNISLPPQTAADYIPPTDVSSASPAFDPETFTLGDALQNRESYQDLINKFFEEYGYEQRGGDNWRKFISNIGLQAPSSSAQEGGFMKYAGGGLLNTTGFTRRIV